MGSDKDKNKGRKGERELLESLIFPMEKAERILILKSRLLQMSLMIAWI